jgi:hypothetical protein
MRTDPKRSWLDSAATLNAACRELWVQLGMSIPYEALTEIRRIRAKRAGRQGTTELKTELKILLAIRDKIPWELGASMPIRYRIPPGDGGDHHAKNLHLGNEAGEAEAS